MDFPQKLMELRRSHGLSQEQLGEKIGVTRQTISKWELGQTTPEMEKLAALSDLFGVSADELIRGTAPSRSEKFKDSKPAYRQLAFEYKSSRTFRGIPLVHVNVGAGRRTARGILAVGNKAFGVLSVGFLSVGVVSFGLLAAGLLAFGSLALGLLSFGCGFRRGGRIRRRSIGVIALGGLAVGVYSMGGAAVASEIAAGGYAQARIAIGDSVHGLVEIRDAIPGEQAREIISKYCPFTPKFLADIFSALAENMPHNELTYAR